jgi:hypothetical protein
MHCSIELQIQQLLLLDCHCYTTLALLLPLLDGNPLLLLLQVAGMLLPADSLVHCYSSRSP